MDDDFRRFLKLCIKLKPVRGTYAIIPCEPSQMGNQAALSGETMRRRNTWGLAVMAFFVGGRRAVEWGHGP